MKGYEKINNIVIMNSKVLNLVYPVKSYGNADLLKDQVLKEARDRSGIYR